LLFLVDAQLPVCSPALYVKLDTKRRMLPKLIWQPLPTVGFGMKL
jgi:hypothetical protein